MAAKFGGSLKCTVCAKSVYPQEKVAIEKLTVHKSCFKCNTCNTTLTVGNYHVVEDKLLCKNHYQQSFAHKAPSADVKSTSTTPRGTTTTTPAAEPKPTATATTPAAKPAVTPVNTTPATKPAVTTTTPAVKPAVTPVTTTAPAAKPTPVTTTPVTKPAVTTTPAAKPAVTPAVTPAATPAAKPADDSKALDSLKQFSAALDKLEHALTAVERRL